MLSPTLVYVLSTLLYAGETLALDAGTWKKINGLKCGCIGVYAWDHIKKSHHK